MTNKQKEYLLRHAAMGTAGVIFGSVCGTWWGLVLVALALVIGTILGMASNGKG